MIGVSCLILPLFYNLLVEFFFSRAPLGGKHIEGFISPQNCTRPLILGFCFHASYILDRLEGSCSSASAGLSLFAIKPNLIMIMIFPATMPRRFEPLGTSCFPLQARGGDPTIPLSADRPPPGHQHIRPILDAFACNNQVSCQNNPSPSSCLLQALSVSSHANYPRKTPTLVRKHGRHEEDLHRRSVPS